MQEPLELEVPSGSSAYRLLVFPAFHAPKLVRIDRGATGWQITGKQTSRQFITVRRCGSSAASRRSTRSAAPSSGLRQARTGMHVGLSWKQSGKWFAIRTDDESLLFQHAAQTWRLRPENEFNVSPARSEQSSRSQDGPRLTIPLARQLAYGCIRGTERWCHYLPFASSQAGSAG